MAQGSSFTWWHRLVFGWHRLVFFVEQISFFMAQVGFGGTGWFWWHMSLWSLWESGAAPNLLMWAQLNIRAAELTTSTCLLLAECAVGLLLLRKNVI